MNDTREIEVIEQEDSMMVASYLIIQEGSMTQVMLDVVRAAMPFASSLPENVKFIPLENPGGISLIDGLEEVDTKEITVRLYRDGNIRIAILDRAGTLHLSEMINPIDLE